MQSMNLSLDHTLTTKPQGGVKAMSQVIGGALLVAGTCIGAGMLGLPVSTAAGGFYYTSGFFLVCWLMMTLTAFFMLEVSLWHKEETNLISMAHQTLGKWAEGVAWVTYVLFLYSIMAAYTSGGTAIASRIFAEFGVPYWLSSTLFIGFFAFIVYLGARWVDWVNRWFMLGLIVAYIGLVGFVTQQVDPTLLQGGQSKYLFAAMPLMVTSFGFHLLIPSLKTYLNNDVKKLRISILLGSLLPLIVYLLWEFIILGVIPKQGSNGLIAMLYEGQPVVELTERLSEIIQSSKVGILARSFSFFAIISSFLGVALGLFDFFADGFHIPKTSLGRLLLAVLTFFPPILFVWLYPQGFIMALNYAGVFAAILLVIFPALMAYVGRYHRKIERDYEVMGGKILPILAIFFGMAVIILQILLQLHKLPMP